MLQAFRGILKPCYLFAPATLVRRVGLKYNWPASPKVEVDLPWGMRIGVDLRDAIGSEIFKQRIFDLGVSECAWRLLQPGDQVIDAGANLGYMTMLFAARTGSAGLVHSFEPHPEVGAALQANVERAEQARNAARVVIHRCALGATRGNANLVETDYFAINQGTASIGRVSNGEGERLGRSHCVAVETLDECFPTERFALLKIDVEGFELEVLKGAERLLSEHRVKHVIYEDHTFGESGLAARLSGHGYTNFAIGHGAFGPRLLDQSAGHAAIDASWESASFLATLDSTRAMRAMQRKGWRVLRGR